MSWCVSLFVRESNDREIDLAWLEDNYNRIGSTFILFDYSEAYL